MFGVGAGTRARRWRAATVIAVAGLAAALLGAAPSGAVAATGTPAISWEMKKRLVGDGYRYTELAFPKTAVVQLRCKSVPGAKQYLWSGSGVKATPPAKVRPEALEERIERSRGGSLPPLPCETTATVPIGAPTVVSLRVRLQNDAVTAVRSVTIRPRDYLIVSMGDSYASGEGAPEVPQQFDLAGYVSRGPVWSDTPCHRSARSGPSQAVADLERADPHSTVTYVHLACSGSVIENSGPFRGRGGLLSEDKAADHCCPEMKIAPQMDAQPGQIDGQLEQIQSRATAAGRQIDALLISAGGNDSGFVPFVMSCSMDILDPFGPSCIDDAYVNPKYAPLKPFTHHVRDALYGGVDSEGKAFDGIAGKLNRVKEKVVDILGPDALERTYLTGYPDLLEGQTGAGLLLLGITPAEATWATNNILSVINQELKNDRGWNFIDVGPKFANHGAARGGARWLNWFTDALLTQGPIPKLCSWRTITASAMLGLGALAAFPCGASLLGWLKDVDRYITKGILHPNELGQRAIADAIVEAVKPDLPEYGR